MLPDDYRPYVCGTVLINQRLAPPNTQVKSGWFTSTDTSIKYSHDRLNHSKLVVHTRLSELYIIYVRTSCQDCTYIHNPTFVYKFVIKRTWEALYISGVPRGGGGQGARAQALEGAPAQLVGANFKSRGEFNLVAYMLWAPRSLCIRRSFFFLPKPFFLSFFCLFFFFARRFFPQGEILIQGGGRRCKHWPPGAGDPWYATAIQAYIRYSL